MRFCAVACLLFSAVGWGCGPFSTTAQISYATAAVKTATTAGAEKAAPYEYTLAQNYLKKAKEEEGYSRYRSAIEFAKKAQTYARTAQEKALSASGAEKQAVDTTTVQETAAPLVPAPAPAAATPAPASTVPLPPEDTEDEANPAKPHADEDTETAEESTSQDVTTPSAEPPPESSEEVPAESTQEPTPPTDGSLP